ncbi:hypothetical protein LguiB_019405 [Lonicera macranthoides]
MHILLLLLFFSLILSLPTSATATQFPVNIPLPTDAVALLSFKSKSDLDNKLLYTLNERFDYCQWQGVKCVQGRVVRFILQGFGLRGLLAPNTLTSLDQLRVLSLRNNSLAGPIPDLGGLPNLRTLFLDHNFFSGTFPNSLPLLHRLINLDLSHNNLSGHIPSEVNALDRLNYLRLEWNHFNGTIPPLNQSTLEVFNVSSNNFSGPIPVTPTLVKFGISSFFMNPNLCGEILNKVCRSSSPFFDSPSSTASPPTPLLQNAQSQGVVLSPPSKKKHKSLGVVLGFVIGVLILIAAILCLFAFFKRRRDQNENQIESKSAMFNDEAVNNDPTETSSNVIQLVNTELEVIHEKKSQVPQRRDKSGNLIFCTGETPFCNLEQLMRASAELLGRGTIGTTYKAAMDNQLIVSVKRLDASKTAITTGEEFERHMEAVGGLRHPNLVSVRAYFQAKHERLIIYDYQPNGSLFNLIHGSRSTRAKPLHWTSCLKIAEDLAMGLSYIHQASRLIHGNLKSSNVLLGPDFEACLTDYCLSILADTTSSNDDPDSVGYRAPELRKSSSRATPKSDVYAFGVLLLELLTGKPPSQHPFIIPADMPEWVRAMRDADDGEDDRLGLLVEVAGVCSLTSPEQRPGMRQVLKMIQEVKESAMMEDHARNGYV